MHSFNTLIIASCKIICQKNIFGMIVRNSKQAIVFSAFGLFRVDFLSYLNIYLFVLSRCNKVYLAVGDLTDIDSIAEQGRQVLDRIDSMAEKVDDPHVKQHASYVYFTDMLKQTWEEKTGHKRNEIDNLIPVTADGWRVIIFRR